MCAGSDDSIVSSQQCTDDADGIEHTATDRAVIVFEGILQTGHCVVDLIGDGQQGGALSECDGVARIPRQQRGDQRFGLLILSQLDQDTDFGCEQAVLVSVLRDGSVDPIECGGSLIG